MGFSGNGVKTGDKFLDGYLLAVARNMPFWSEDDLPFLPSAESIAVKGLLKECTMMLNAYSTTMETDLKLLGNISKIPQK